MGRRLAALSIAGASLPAVSGAHPVAASASTAACSFHQVDQTRLYNAAGLQVGSVLLYVDGCGYAQGYTRSIIPNNLEVDLYSDNVTFNVTPCSGPNTYNCWSPRVYVGSRRVAVYGWIFSDLNGALVAYGTTGFHQA